MSASYEDSSVNEARIRQYARKVTAALHIRGEPARRPRPASATTEEVSEGFLGLGRRTIVHHDDGGMPLFWIIGAQRESGVFIAYRAGRNLDPYGWMGGWVVILLENGELGSGRWREDPLGSYWKVSDFDELSSLGMTALDYADRGQWRKARPLQGEQYREEFRQRSHLTARSAGVGLTLSLKRLLEGSGARKDGYATGMHTSWTPRGPV